MVLYGEEIEVIKYRGKKSSLQNDPVIIEKPVSLYVNGVEWLTFSCTPMSLEDLGVGFLYNEGFLHSYDEIASVEVCKYGEIIDIWTSFPLEKPASFRRTSGCTGGLTYNNTLSTGIPSDNDFSVGPEILFSCMDQLTKNQAIYKEVGGVHSSGVFTRDAKLIQIMEDIGRHNTLDKLAGWLLTNKLPLQDIVLTTTGRVSSDMMVKSAKIGAVIVISRSSPTTLAIDIANRAKITLVGYFRTESFNIYSHSQRIDIKEE